MKYKSQRRRITGLTLIEVIIVTVIAAVVLAVLLERAAKARSRAQRISCVGNLKQLGIAFRGFGIDLGSFPMHLSNTHTATNNPAPP
jgi:type II secretory pathway pseudopilin PulG